MSKGQIGKLFQVSLSTMWGQGRFKSMAEFAAKAKKFGFSQVEAHNSLSPKMLEELLRTSVPISSIHSPCPATLSSKGIPSSALLLSSTEESERREAVSYVSKTIELASRIGAGIVIIHMGQMTVNADLEDKLRRLYDDGLGGGEMYEKVKGQLVTERQSKAPQHLAAAKKSLEELSKYGKNRGVLLGLENRVSFCEMPSIDEMQELLDVADRDTVGYWHDVGHAEVQQRLGFTNHKEWLLRFGYRIIGIHLHDVIGISDHQVPGRGNVNWGLISEYLPQKAVRTCEVNQWNDDGLVQEAIPFLEGVGIIRRGD